MSEHNLSSTELEQLVTIAKKNISSLQSRPDLEPRHCDGEDFFDVAVWCLKDALVAAYMLGREHEKERSF